MIESLICIGSGCEGHEFAKVLDLRTQGPVDNLAGDGFHATVELFNGTFESNIDNYITFEVPDYEKYNILPIGYKIGSYKMVHNNLTEEKTYNELKRRIMIFKNYVLTAYHNPNKYFLISPSNVLT